MSKLFVKLLEIQKAISGLKKDKSGNNYAYVSGNKLLGFVRPLMDKYGVILILEITESNFERQNYTVYGNNGTPREKAEIFCSLKMKFTWVDAESGETLECKWASSGMNAWDKGVGSAITYGERYFLLKFFHISTDEDDVDRPKTEIEEMNSMNAIQYIESLSTVADLDAAWQQYQQFWKDDKEVIRAFNKQKKKLHDAK